MFSWLICESYDDKGNAIYYEYAHENKVRIDPDRPEEHNRLNGPGFAQRYLKRIKYGNRTPRIAAGELALRDDWLFEVVFDYGEPGRYQVLDPDPEGREFVNASAISLNYLAGSSGLFLELPGGLRGSYLPTLPASPHVSPFRAGAG